MNNKEIICRLRKELDFKRYEHTCGVAYTSAALAMRWDADVNKAYLQNGELDVILLEKDLVWFDTRRRAYM